MGRYAWYATSHQENRQLLPQLHMKPVNQKIRCRRGSRLETRISKFLRMRKQKNARDPKELTGAERGSSVIGSHLAPKEKLLPWIPLNPSEVLPLASSHLCIHSEFEGAACMCRRMVSILHQVVQSSLVAVENSLHLQVVQPAGRETLL